MMNAALTIGACDGANIEMAEEAGKDSLFRFILTAEQVGDKRSWYGP
jgi:starch phosphorylase